LRQIIDGSSHHRTELIHIRYDIDGDAIFLDGPSGRWSNGHDDHCLVQGSTKAVVEVMGFCEAEQVFRRWRTGEGKDMDQSLVEVVDQLKDPSLVRR
jgi:hypothetical protein